MAHEVKAQIWRALQGFSAYEVSDDGQVRRATDHWRLSALKAGHIVPQWLIKRTFVKKTGDITILGYMAVSIVPDGQRKPVNRLVHVLVANAFLPPRPSPKHQVAHCNGRRFENWAGNLRWATAAENQADRNEHGTSNRGSRHGMSKLTEDDVADIRRRILSGQGVTAIARAYGVGHPTISNIKTGKTWGSSAGSAAKDTTLKQIAAKR